MPDWRQALRPQLDHLRLSPEREAEIIEEVSQHLDERYEDIRRSGASDDEARRLATEELAAEDHLGDQLRSLRQARAMLTQLPDVTSHRWFEPLRQDFRYAVRVLVRSPRFVSIVLAMLTLGIGVNVAVFSVVDAVLLRPLPFGSRSDRIVTLHSTFGQQVSALGGMSYPDVLDLQDRLRSFEGVAGLVRRDFTISTNSDADRLLGCYVTPELFRVLGVAPMLGRHFSFEDAAAPGFEATVIVTHGLWQRRLGGDVSVVGSSVTINDRPHTVVGVMPPGFGFLTAPSSTCRCGSTCGPKRIRSHARRGR
jgi:putative ABC transport system permease protein